MSAFYTRLRAIMRSANITLADLAADLEVNASTVRTWFSTKPRLPADVVYRIAQRFGVSVEYLLTGRNRFVLPQTAADALYMLNAACMAFRADVWVDLGMPDRLRIEIYNNEACEFFELRNAAIRLVDEGVPEKVVASIIDSALKQYDNILINEYSANQACDDVNVNDESGAGT